MADEFVVIDYLSFLHQGLLWPSSSAGEVVEISGMHPAQAINSYHRLLANMDDRTNVMNRSVYNSPLAQALLEQAVGEKVTFTADIKEPEMYAEPVLPSIGACKDILKAMELFEGEDDIRPEDINARARMLRALIYTVNEGEADG